MTDNNNIEDFDQPEAGSFEELPPRRGGVSGNLAEAWRSRPMFKLFVVMLVVAAIVAAGVGFFSGNAQRQDNATRLPKPPEVKEASGGNVSPYFAEQIKQANEQRAKEALQTGGSAIPTAIGKVTTFGDPGNTETKNDPLRELKAEIERMKQEQERQRAVQTQTQQQEAVKQAQPFDDSLAQAMQRQMQTLMDGWTPPRIQQVSAAPGSGVGGAKDLGPLEPGAASTVITNTGAGVATAPGGTPIVSNIATAAKTVVPAGTVSYAQLLTEANSDVPGPILAQILSGPLSGARAVGQFQVSNGYADYLVLRFNLVNYKGRDYQIDGIALDPDTTLGGMATEVDQRYFSRVILPAAAGFLQAFGSALGQGSSSIEANNNTTIVTQSRRGFREGIYSGIGQAGQTASQFFQNQANQIKPLVRVAANTPIGFFFVSSVIETGGQLYSPGLQGNPNNPAGYANVSGVAGVPGYGVPQQGFAGGYPGTTVTGFGGQPQYQSYNTGGNNVPYPNPGSFNPTGFGAGLGGGFGGFGGYPGFGAYNAVTPNQLTNSAYGR